MELCFCKTTKTVLKRNKSKRTVKYAVSISLISVRSRSFGDTDYHPPFLLPKVQNGLFHERSLLAGSERGVVRKAQIAQLFGAVGEVFGGRFSGFCLRATLHSEKY